METLPSTMRAAVLYGKEDVRIELVSIPELAPGELLIKIGAALTCGTDLKVFRRGYHAAMIRPPSVFGHECAGTVVAVSSDKSGFKHSFAIGDRVVVANSAPCGDCYFCKRDQENLCSDLQFLNGAYAEYLKIPARFVEKNMYSISNSLSFAEAAMVEPLACVIHGLQETPFRKGDRVAVLGLGPIGLMFVALLKKEGASVFGVGKYKPRLKLAEILGADQVLEADEDEVWYEKLKKGPPLDIVIEATGRPETWEQAIHLVRKGGVVNLFGGCPAGTSIRLDTQYIHYHQITIKSPFHHRPTSIRLALRAITDGIVQPKLFITDQKPLEAVPSLLAEMIQTKKVVKTCIVP